VYVPEFAHPISAVIAGRVGTIWLRGEEYAAGETIEWLVLSAEGDIIATFAAPRESRLIQAEQGTAWGVVLDDMDVPFVVRYNVRRVR
jgi:hypothetical protein